MAIVNIFVVINILMDFADGFSDYIADIEEKFFLSVFLRVSLMHGDKEIILKSNIKSFIFIE